MLKSIKAEMVPEGAELSVRYPGQKPYLAKVESNVLVGKFRVICATSPAGNADVYMVAPGEVLYVAA